MSDTINKDEVEFDEDVFESMLHGTFEAETSDTDEVEEEGVEEDADTAEDFDEEDNEDQEDTDQEEDSEDDEELDEADDGELDEDSEDEDDDEEEDSLVEDYDSDDEDSDGEDEDDTDTDEVAEESEDGDTDEESEDEADTEETSDGEAQDTDGVDYKAFYDAVVNTEFVVNGRKTKGFADPQKIIQSQQMAGGFSEKMAGFKQYRPFMAPLKERGMLEDQTKFDLAMNLIDGDKEAIKKHLQSLEIDPLDLDMEKIEYSGKPTVASQESLVIEDVMERAKATGIEDRVRQVVGKDWDAESFQEFVSNDAVREDLLNHIETGAYDAVQDKMLEMSRLDVNGSFGAMNTISKYRAAVRELQAEQPAAQPSTPVVEPKATTPKKVAKKPTVKAEKAKIEQARKEEEYKAKAAKREAKLTQQRKKAASMSRKKAKAKPKPKFDPLKVEGEELDNLMDFLISGGRG